MSYYVPIVLENTGRGERSMDIYSRLLKDRIIFIGTPIDDIAPGAVSATLRYAAARRLSTYFRVAAFAAHSDAGPSEVATPVYRMADAGASWRVRRHLEIRGVGRNLLNARYYSSAGPRWVYAPGRHGSVTMVVRY